MMKKLFVSNYLVITGIGMLLTLPVTGQQLVRASPEEQCIFLNDLKKHARIPLRQDTLYMSARSLRQEELRFRITKGNEMVKEFSHILHYGMNTIEMALAGLESNLQKGEVFHVHLEGNYFGTRSFELFGDSSPLMPAPLASIQVNSLDARCDKGLASSMEFLGSVQGGIAPYRLTWLVSKGPYIRDLVNRPLNFTLISNQDICRLVVEESLDYYVTLLVEDVCGNSDKQVMHIKCKDDEDDGMIYFQLIDLNPTEPNAGLKK